MRKRFERFDGSFVDPEALAGLVLEYLKANPPAASYAIRDALGYSDEAIRATLRTLFDRRLVKRCGTGSRNWVWSLVSRESGQPSKTSVR